MMKTLEISPEIKDTVIFEVRLEGEFDLSERRRVTDAFSISADALLVALNLSKTEYIDSTILQCMIALQLVTQRRGARLIVSGARGSVLRLLEVTGFDHYFDLQPNLDALSTRADIRRLTLVSGIESKAV